MPHCQPQKHTLRTCERSCERHELVAAGPADECRTGDALLLSRGIDGGELEIIDLERCRPHLRLGLAVHGIAELEAFPPSVLRSD